MNWEWNKRESAIATMTIEYTLLDISFFEKTAMMTTTIMMITIRSKIKVLANAAPTMAKKGTVDKRRTWSTLILGKENDHF
jgi:hypothetical protein